MTQLLLPFDTDTKINILEIRVEQAEKSSENVRRGIYARHNELAKKFIELQERLTLLEGNLCRSK